MNCEICPEYHPGSFERYPDCYSKERCETGEWIMQYYNRPICVSCELRVERVIDFFGKDICPNCHDKDVRNGIYDI